MICPECGKKMGRFDTRCRNCGHNMVVSGDGDDSGIPMEGISQGRKSIILAWILSLLFPGVGAFYLSGRPAILLIFLAVLFLGSVGLFLLPLIGLFLIFVLWLYGLYLTFIEVRRTES